MTEFTGPLWVIGDQGQLESAPGGAILLPEPTGGTELGPSGFFGGTGIPDVRYTFLKDLVQGYVGRVPTFLESFQTVGVQAVPMAHATNNIAAGQTVASGAAMALVSVASQGISVFVPIVPFTGVLNSLGTATSVTTAPIVLDMGFGWCGTTNAGSAVTVADSTLFVQGMPLCIPHAGNSGGTAALLTNVVSIASSTVIQVGPNLPLSTQTQTPIGTGNAWGPSEFASSQVNSPYPVPTAYLPYVALGPGLFLDPRQSIARGLVISTVGTASSGSMVVSGWDLYWAPQTEIVATSPTTLAGGSLFYTKKTYKALSSVTPLFGDPGHNWSVGTSDVYGFPLKTDLAELAVIWWNGTQMSSTTGFTVPDFTATATSSTGDVRGTIQFSTLGSLATGMAGGGSTGTVSSGSFTPTGSRLVMYSTLSNWNQLQARLTMPYWQTGRMPA